MATTEAAPAPQVEKTDSAKTAEKATEAPADATKEESTDASKSEEKVGEKRKAEEEPTGETDEKKCVISLFFKVVADDVELRRPRRSQRTRGKERVKEKTRSLCRSWKLQWMRMMRIQRT